MNIIKMSLLCISGFILYWLGGLDNSLVCLLALITIDFILGLLSASRNKKLNSEKCWIGIVKKTTTLLVVALSFIIEKYTDKSFALRETVIMFFIVNEGISIVENSAKLGIPIPESITKVLTQLKKEGENDG